MQDVGVQDGGVDGGADGPGERAALPPWTVWPVLVAAAAPLLFLLVEVQRVLLGSGPDFLADGDASTYTRNSYLLQAVAPDRVLFRALLALAVAAWLLARPVAPRPDLARLSAVGLTGAVAAASCGVLLEVAYVATSEPPSQDSVTFFGGGTQLDSLGPLAATALVAAVLSAVLLRLLWAGRAPEPEVAVDGEVDPGPVRLTLGDAAPDEEPFDDEPAIPDVAVAVRLVEEPTAARVATPAPDGLAAYRRPDAAPAVREQPETAPAPASADAHSPFRRPPAPVARDESDPQSAYRRS